MRGAVAGISLTPEVLYAGGSATGTLTLASPAAERTVVAVRTTAPGLLGAPAALIVPAGARTATFTVVTRGAGTYRLRAEPAALSAHLFLDVLDDLDDLDDLDSPGRPGGPTGPRPSGPSAA